MGSRKTQQGREEEKTPLQQGVKPSTTPTPEPFADIHTAKAYSAALQRKEKELHAPKQNFSIARDLIGQLIPARPVIGNLFTILEEEVELAEDAKNYEAQGKLFSIITDGINAGATGKKVVLGIAKEAYRQAAMFGNPLRDGFGGIIEHARQQGFYSERNIGGKMMPSLFIRVSLSDLTKYCKGTSNSSNRADVHSIIKKLSENIVFWKSPDNNRHLKVNVIGIEAEYTDKATGRKEYLLEVKPLFYASISKGYVTASESDNSLIPLLKKDIEMNLYLYLLDLLSKKTEPGYPNLKRIKEKADARIIPDYYIRGSRQKDLNKDFDRAVKTLIKGGVLLEPGIELKVGANNVTLYYIFHLNPNYNDTSRSLPK